MGIQMIHTAKSTMFHRYKTWGSRGKKQTNSGVSGQSRSMAAQAPPYLWHLEHKVSKSCLLASWSDWVSNSISCPKEDWTCLIWAKPKHQKEHGFPEIPELEMIKLLLLHFLNYPRCSIWFELSLRETAFAKLNSGKKKMEREIFK